MASGQNNGDAPPPGSLPMSTFTIIDDEDGSKKQQEDRGDAGEYNPYEHRNVQHPTS